MISRIQQYRDDLPFFITLDECKNGDIDTYEGAGAAVIVCAGDTILDLVYVETDEQIAETWATAVLSGCDVYFGMCSCYALCDILDISECKDNNHAIQTMIKHGKEKKFMGYA